MDKEALLALYAANLERLTRALEGIPREDLARLGLVGGWSVKEVCAFLTAWDGEILRRIDYLTGASFKEPHDYHDSAYWTDWGQKQVEIKRVMAVQGILVDLVGTRQRLLSRLADLNDFQFERWLEADPQATQPYYGDYLAKIEAWRAEWEQQRPAQNGLKKLWEISKRWLGRN
jgi:hypothetical protein